MATIESGLSINESLLTAEDFRVLPASDYPTELVRGRLIEVNMPGPRHGWICGRIVYLLSQYLEEHPLGRVLGNDSAIVTQRGPDSVRGADVAYYSFDRLPRGPLPDVYLTVTPEIVFEVRSPSDRWVNVLAKVAEYLLADVLYVCVADPVTERIDVYTPEQPGVSLAEGDELTFPDLLPGFSLAVSRVFQ
jgi:Uma2 family endonuclease